MKVVLTAVVVFLASLLAPAGCIYKSYSYDKDIDSVINRDQVAGDAEDMQKHLITLRDNMKARGWTEGHTAFIWKTPDNDMGLQYKTVNRLIDRLEGIKTLPTTDVAYQVALDDVRGTVRELPNPASGMLWIDYWWLQLLAILSGITAVLAVFMGGSRLAEEFM